MAPKVLVLGSNFAGLTAALAVKHELEGDVEVTVISKDDRFVFNPSFIWIPFGKRTPADITFPVAPTFDAHQIVAELDGLTVHRAERVRRPVDTAPEPGVAVDTLVRATRD